MTSIELLIQNKYDNEHEHSASACDAECLVYCNGCQFFICKAPTLSSRLSRLVLAANRPNPLPHWRMPHRPVHATQSKTSLIGTRIARAACIARIKTESQSIRAAALVLLHNLGPKQLPGFLNPECLIEQFPFIEPLLHAPPRFPLSFFCSQTVP